MQIYIAGIMQGSREDDLVNTQDYRSVIAEALEKKYTNVSVIDPFALYPESINYDIEQARKTFEDEVALAVEADMLIAYLPEASMGTAIEIWEAYRAERIVFTISPLAENWVIKLLGTRNFVTLEEFETFVESGELRKFLENYER